MTNVLSGEADVLEVKPYDFADPKSGKQLKGCNALIRLANRDVSVTVAEGVQLEEGDKQELMFSVSKSTADTKAVRLTIEGVK